MNEDGATGLFLQALAKRYNVAEGGLVASIHQEWEGRRIVVDRVVPGEPSPNNADEIRKLAECCGVPSDEIEVTVRASNDEVE